VSVIRIIALLSLACLGACDYSPTPPMAARQAGWAEDDVIGWRYSRESDTHTYDCVFLVDGTSPHTSILKDQTPPKDDPDGPPPAPVAPMFYWSIDEKGILLISGTESPDDTFARWEVISLAENSAKVRVNGRVKSFTRSRR
jgi:hypothetical protein